MKKQSILTVIFASAVLLFAACSGGTGAKDVSLENEVDSLNYALGVMNGISLKESFFANDSSDSAIAEFIKSVDRAFNAKDGEDMYERGLEIGKMLSVMKTDGLEQDSDVPFNEELLIQGVINGLKKFEDGMTPEEAMDYYQSSKQKKRQSSFSVEGFEDELEVGEN